MADVFLSHSNEDRDRIEPLVTALRLAGFSVWWDRELYGGTVYSEKIEVEAHKAKIVVVAWTENSVKSQWVADEAEIGRSVDKLVPIILDNVQPPIGFRQIQTIDFLKWDGKPDAKPIRSLTDSIVYHIGSAPAAKNAIGAAPEASIAVLPFVNMSSDPEQEYFSDGISEELLNQLSKIKDMRVTARTSSFQFKGQSVDISKVGQILGVSYILEGSVRKGGKRVRITAQLIEAVSGFHMWSESYDRTLNDVFAVQDEISAAIVGAINDQLLSVVEAPAATRSTNVEAYEQYLFGRQFLSRRTHESIELARSYFERAIALDPDYQPALIALADSHLLLSDSTICYGTEALKEARAKARPLLDRAIALNANSDEAHVSYSFYYDLNNEFEKALSHAEKAIAINPNSSRAYRAVGLILKRSGEPRAPVVAIREKVLNLNPASPTDLINLFGELPPRGRFRDAEILLEKIEAVEPNSIFNDWGKFYIAWLRGDIKDSLAIFSQSDKLCRDRQWFNQLQIIATLFGFGPSVESADFGSALEIYCSYGFPAEANRLALALENNARLNEGHIPKLTLALWHSQQGRFENARHFLSSIDDTARDEWGSYFYLDNFCLGARMSWLVSLKLGDKERTAYYRGKLKELYSVRIFDHEGVHFATHYIGACIAAMDGDHEQALGEIQHFVDRAPGPAKSIFFDPLLQDVAKEPAFQKMMKKVEDVIATEKQAATDDNLLPLRESLLAVTA